MSTFSEQQEFVNTFIQQIKIRKKIIILSFSLLILVPPIALFVSTVAETNSIGKSVLGEERYNIRMHDSYMYSIYLLALLSLFIGAIMMPLNKFLNRYIKVVKSLSNEDILKLKKLNDNLGFIEKYWPSYIIKQKEIIFFKLFEMPVFSFNDLTKLNIKRGYGKNNGYLLKLTTNNGINKYMRLSGNHFQIENLIDEVLSVNPKIEITKN